MAEETPLAGNDTIDLNQGSGAPARAFEPTPSAPTTPNLVIPDLASQPLPGNVPTEPAPIQPTPPTAPKPKYAPGSFAEKLARAADNLGIPPGPAGWAKALVGGAQAALANAGDVVEGTKNLPPGSGPLAGALGTIAAGNRRVEAAKQQDQAAKEREQARQDRLKQQGIENDRLTEEAHARIAMSNVQRISIQKAETRRDLDDMNKKAAQGASDIAHLESQEVPAEVVPGGHLVDEDEMHRMLSQGKMNGYEYTAVPVKVAQKGQDKDGNDINRFLYDVVKIPDTWKPSEDQLSRIHTIPGWEKFQPGAAMPGSQVQQLLTQADLIKTGLDDIQENRTNAKLSEFSREQKLHAVNFVKDGAFQKYLNVYDGNAVVAAQHMLQDGRARYADVMSLFADKNDPTGVQNYERMRHDQADERIKENESKLKSEAEGNPAGIAPLIVDPGGNMDPTQLSKRSKTYDAQIKAIDDYAKEKYGDKPSPDGYYDGKHFNIAKAQEDFKYANRGQVQDTLTYLNSLTGLGKGNNPNESNLGQLVKLSDQIKRTEFPPINDVAAWARLKTGDPQMAAYEAAVTEVADQVAKILQGGNTGGGTTDAKLKQAQALFNVGFTKDQIRDVANTLLPLLANRRNTMIGDNRYMIAKWGPQVSETDLARAFTTNKLPGRPQGVGPDWKLMQAPGGQPHWLAPDQAKIAADKFKATEVSQ